eukprot:7486235-Alexandrium_andersonii.AAC.1
MPRLLAAAETCPVQSGPRPPASAHWLDHQRPAQTRTTAGAPASWPAALPSASACSSRLPPAQCPSAEAPAHQSEWISRGARSP